jgi:hypothetical protein
MIKHVGKHNNKRCIILFRTVPNEDHMCLVVYPDTLPRHIHDDIMAALESESGQQAKEFSDYLFRVTLSDGNNALEVLHKEGMIKKVPTNQVIVVPNAKSNVRLDELNEILNKFQQGEEAVKELADLDKNAGMTSKRRVNEGRNIGEVRAPRESRSTPAQVQSSINLTDVLTDEQLAAQRLAQAQKMAAEAKQLLAEAERLQKEAESMTGAKKDNGRTTKPKKTTKAKTQEA